MKKRHKIIIKSILVILVFALFVANLCIITTKAGKKQLPIYSVKTEEKKVALSFDAAWGNEDTATLLDILSKNNVKATFFMTGGWIETYPEDVKAIKAAGHDLGNHSENHKQMDKLSAEKCLEEIKKPHDKVVESIGEDMFLFRPPYGAYNDILMNALRECGYYGIQWSVDSLDWKDYGSDSIVKTVLNHKNLKPGAIILMHNGAKYTKDALPKIIKGLRDMGYEIVPVSELIYTNNYEINHLGEQVKK